MTRPVPETPEEPRLGATGPYTDRGVPRGVSSLTPYLAVGDVTAAARFYGDVFDARTVTVTRPGEVAIHAQLDFGHGHLHLEMPNPTGGGLAEVTAPDGADRLAFSYYCEDVEAVAARALAAGAQLLGPAHDFVSGDRILPLRDPFGIRWSITSRVIDLSESDSAHRVAEWAAQSAQPR